MNIDALSHDRRRETVSGDRWRVRHRWLTRLGRNRLSIVGATLAFFFLIIGIFASVIAPHDYAAINLPHKLEPPSLAFPFGTDQLGRDILSRAIWGARSSLIIAIASTFVGSVIGVVLGLVAGYMSGWVDEGVMRLMDVMLAFPAIVLGIAMAAVLGPSLGNLALIIGFTQIPTFARVARASSLAINEQDYVTAVRAMGQSPVAILAHHILPNMIGPLIVLASLTFPAAIIAEAAFSFLGLGVQPPIPSWGNLVFDGNRYLLRYPWLAVIPAVVICVAVWAFNILGDGLRDAFDPRADV
jgi:peptide/nickel transport system permease protein